MRSVQKTSELVRILNLPTRKVDVENLIDPLSAWLRKDHVCGPNCAGGVVRLKPLQAAALSEAHDNGGLFLAGPIGCGKSLVSVLAPTVFGAKRALLIVPGGLLEKTEEDIKTLSEHWRIVPFEVVSYELLSRPENSELLFELAPDLLILDEAHKAKGKRSAIRRRIPRYLKKSRVPVLIMSGTPAKRSITDFAHTMHWALRDLCPLPIAESDLRDWSLCLDAGVQPYNRLAPGCLYTFGNDIRSIRQGLRGRIFATPGCLAAETNDLDVKLKVHLVNLPLSETEDECYKTLREDWATPDGHTFSDAVELWRHARELACGFFGVWSPRPPESWMSARRDWHAAVREYLSRSRKLDTERQVRDEVRSVSGHKLKRWLDRWEDVKDTFEPNSVPCWVGDTALLFAATWLQEGGVAWVEHVPFGARLSQITGIPCFGEGGRTADGGLSIVSYRGRSAISTFANATGHNLQHWDRGLLVSIKPTGTIYDQTIGRLHRSGQKKPLVTFYQPISCKEQLSGFEKARSEDAAFHQDLLQIPSRLLTCELTSDRIDQKGRAWK